MTEIRTGFFAYPWDLLDPGPEQVIDQMANDLDCNAVVVCAQYHHARVLRPRAEGPKTRHYNQALAAFTPNPELYAECGLSPVVNEELVEAQVLNRAREAARSRQMDFGFWLVGLHNSSLGEQHPELCVENCFGDTYTYALCPSQARSQQYLQALAQDVCDQFAPDRIVLEAVGVLGLRHWVHHELFMTEWDESLELLTSVCFCPACTEKGRQAGINVAVLRQQVSGIAEALFEEERGALPESFRQGEVPSLLFEVEGLWDYLQLCTQAVTELVAGVSQTVRDAGVELETIPASFHRPSSRAYLERASLQALSQVSDRLLLSPYFTSAAEVEADLRWVTHAAPGANLSAVLNACAPTPSAGILAGQAGACIEVGCQGVYFYNYGLLTHRRLGWVGQAIRSITK
ncbi:MAG TPA: hypothetical protein VJ965_11720 [Anaerolineales bacterium]|nr:hypothetical protein [Anaerolineales bacterium]